MLLFSVLAINGHTLNSFQKGIDLTNKNINNLDNKDYSRERAVFNELSGFGVTMAEAHRIYDRRFFDRFVHENQQMHYYQEASSSLDTIQNIFNDIHGTGFAKDMDAYYHALNDIIAEPENIPARTNFLEKAKVLVSKFKGSYEALQNEKTNLQQSMQQDIETLNRLTSSLAKINQKIAGQPSTLVPDQEKRNTLLNQRDKLIKQISSMIDTKVRYNPNGTADLFSAKGHALVVADKHFKLSFEKEEKDLGNGLSTYSIKIQIGGVELSDEIKSGKLGAKLQIQENIDDTTQKLNSLVIAFAKKQNEVHKTGYDLNDTQGQALFAPDDNTLNISTIQVAITDPKKIAASSTQGTPSNNEVAKNLLATQKEPISDLEDRTFHDYYAQMVAALGAQKSYMESMSEQSAQMVDAIDRKLQEIGGVNLDEELVNLTQLQRSYQASARVLSVTDELLQTVMNIIR